MPRRLQRIHEYVACLALVVASVLLTLIVLELACRLWHGPNSLFDWSNSIVAARVGVDAADSDLVRDSTLGFVPKPGVSSLNAHHDAYGSRVAPSGPPLVGPLILTTGDSFAYGAEVSDGETWQAYLQGLTQRRFVNAGVPGYGLDQIVLRTELLASSLQPSAIIVSFIADDVRRSELLRLWGRGKPYFSLHGSSLELRNTPVPPDPPRGSSLSWWHRALGWSFLLDAVENRLFENRSEWLGDRERALPRGSGEGLVCPLMRRLASLGIPTLMVAQYDPTPWRIEAHKQESHRLSLLVLQCAANSGLSTFDLFEPIDKVVHSQGIDTLYGTRSEHHSPEGNQFVAGLLAQELTRLRMLP